MIVLEYHYTGFYVGAGNGTQVLLCGMQQTLYTLSCLYLLFNSS